MNKDENQHIDEATSSNIKIEVVDIDTEDSSTELKLAANCSNG